MTTDLPFSGNWTRYSRLCSFGLVMCAGMYGYYNNANAITISIKNYWLTVLWSWELLLVQYITSITSKIKQWTKWFIYVLSTIYNMPLTIIKLSKAIRFAADLWIFKIWPPPVTECVFYNPINWWMVFSTQHLQQSSVSVIMQYDILKKLLWHNNCIRTAIYIPKANIIAIHSRKHHVKRTHSTITTKTTLCPTKNDS